jgi:signal transduction histidine kinase
MLSWLEDGILEVPDTSQDERLKPFISPGAVGGSHVAIPLVDEGRTLGVLALGYFRHVGRFSRRQISLAKGLAHHALIALGNARLVHSLREANQFKADFIAAASHDLRTPLHVMMGYNEMLLEGSAGDLSVAQRHLLERMHDCAVRFLDLINDILEIGRLDAGRDSVTYAPLDLASVCEEVRHDVAHLQQPGVELRCSVPNSVVLGDAAKVKMILRNLLSNALKFTTSGEVEVDATLEGDLVLQVRDTGPGIDPRERRTVFDMFRQGSAGLQSGGSGLGLGLYLVKRLSEMLGGSVELVAAEPGRTVFQVSLPLRPPGASLL